MKKPVLLLMLFLSISICNAADIAVEAGKIPGCTLPLTVDGKAVVFDGKSSFAVADSAGFAPENALTVSCRYQFDGTDFKGKDWVCLVDKSDTSRNGFVLQYYFGQPAILLNTDKGTFKVDRFTPGFRKVGNDREPHELSAVYDGSALSLFLDGRRLGAVPASGTIRRCRRAVTVGGAAALKGRYFTGRIFSVKLTDRADPALTAAQGSAGSRIFETPPAVAAPFRFSEDDGKLVIGNRAADFIFRKNGSGLELADIDVKGHGGFAVGDSFMAGWKLEFQDAPPCDMNSATKITGKVECTPGRLTLLLERSEDSGTISERYSVTPDGQFIRVDAVYTRAGGKPAMLNFAFFDLENAVPGRDIAQTRFIYPPHAFNFLHGAMTEADARTMNARYIYGNMMSTDKLMLPYAMIYHRDRPQTLALSIVKRDAKNFVGVFGGKTGSLRTRSAILKRLAPGQREDLPTVIISFFTADWQRAMAAQREMMLKEYQWRKVRRTTADLEDMVILWDGMPGVNVETYADLAKWMPEYRKLGINALIAGGRMWYCYFEKDPASGVTGYIPIPVNGEVIPSEKSGGMEGLKILRKACADNQIRLMAWGPVSMSGMDKHADEGKTSPEWFNRKADGSWNKWYSFMIPGNPGNPGWRKFYVGNAVKMLTAYGLQGIWLDSSWQDHRSNELSPTGYFGESNGNVYSLMREIAAAVDRVNPDAVLMGETGGVEAHMALDLVYSAMHGVWPGIPPEEVQNLVIAEDLCRLPGFRHFGQVTMGLGFLPTLKDRDKVELAKKYRDSWIARTFLVSTSECTPVYFGLNWSIGHTLRADRKTLNAESNPELRMAKENAPRNAAWVKLFARLNEIRHANPELRRGRTIFSDTAVSDRRIVHFVRQNDSASSVVLLNADVQSVSFTCRICPRSSLRLEGETVYQIRELVSGRVIDSLSGKMLTEKGIDLTLAPYQGVILKLVRP